MGSDVGFVHSLRDDLRLAIHVACRVLSIAFTAGLIGLTAVYINDLVLRRESVTPLAIVLLLGFSISIFYYFGSGCFYYMNTQTGNRFNWLALIDMLLAACYAGFAGYLGNLGLGTSRSCEKKQFDLGHLNRYNMGYLNNDHSILGWAKSSYEHCTHSMEMFAFTIIVAGSLISSAIVCVLNYIQEYRKGGD